MDVGLITESRKFLCPLFFRNYLVRLIPHSARTTSGFRAEGSYLGEYGTVHVYGTIHEYSGAGHLYLGDNLL